jgi:hypothetical protein
MIKTKLRTIIMKNFGNKLLARIYIKLFLVIIISAPLLFLYAKQNDDKAKAKEIQKEGTASGQLNKSSRTNQTGSVYQTLSTQGLSKYFRYAIVSGNLVNGGISNSGLLGYHYVSGCPFMGWPKGSKNVGYLHGAVFYVAAQVVDANGDTVDVVSDNYRRSGVQQSPDQSHWYAFMPLPKYFNNHQTNSVDWDMGGISEDVGIDGVPNSHDSGEGDGILQAQEDFNGNGKLDLSLINSLGWFAISDKKETWPTHWPAKSFIGDTRNAGEDDLPSSRDGRWNGAYGAYVRADQETYYVMDDRENDEYNYFPFEDAASKQAWPNGRRGLGLTVTARSYQWANPLAEDILICTYKITNNGKPLEKAVVGMLVDPDMGGDLSGDDASFDSLASITYAWNKTGVTNAGLPTGYFGFAFLQSPGIDYDGKDNDHDGYIDESQYNDVDENHNWVGWDDVNHNGVWDNEDKNFNGVLDPGEDLNGNGILDWEPLNDDLGSDGLGPGMDGYTGPDKDGTEANGKPDQGEPHFGVTDNVESDQVGLTSFYLRDCDNTMANEKKYWDLEIKPGVFYTRAGYQRDISFSYGSGYIKLKTGENNSQFYAIACLFGNDVDDITRNKRTMQVIYDNDYNFAKPPRKPTVSATAGDKMVFLQWDDRAESSYDPIYGKDFEAYYVYKSTDPTFADIKTISDAFGNPFLFKAIAIYDLKDGLTGINPIPIGSEIGASSSLGVSYNMGTDSGLKHYYVDNDVTNGRTYYYAIVSVDKGYTDDFYTRGLADKKGLQTISPTTCSSNIQINTLGVPISTDQNTVIVTPSEVAAGWTSPHLSDAGISHVSGSGTGSISVSVISPNSIKDGRTYHVQFGDDGVYEDFGANYTGKTNLVTIYDKALNVSIMGVSDPDNNERAKEILVDGLKISISNQATAFDTTCFKWTKGSSNLSPTSTTDKNYGVAVPRNYEIRILDSGADTSVNAIATNFQVWDVTNPDSSFKVKIRYIEGSSLAATRGQLKSGDRIQFVSNTNYSKRMWIFDFAYASYLGDNDKVQPAKGDILKLTPRKAFNRNDAFEFTMVGNSISAKKVSGDMSKIYTVPDPYVGVSTLERKVINQEEGRGNRRIDFVNLPSHCTISIFTTSGRLVRKLDHDVSENNARQAWDLRTNDGLEISSGVYFYVVEAKGLGKKTGRLAVIK